MKLEVGKFYRSPSFPRKLKFVFESSSGDCVFENEFGDAITLIVGQQVEPWVEKNEKRMYAPALVFYKEGEPFVTERFYSSEEEARQHATLNANHFIQWPAYKAEWPKL